MEGGNEGDSEEREEQKGGLKKYREVDEKRGEERDENWGFRVGG